MRIALVCTLLFTSLSGFCLDSLRVETKGGRQFVVHQVESKETLYGLSRRYQVTIDEIKAVNPTAIAGLRIGQEVMIPLNQPVAVPSKSPGERTHMVDVGETLYSISRQYDLTVDEIIELNNLPTNDLNVGQVLNLGARDQSVIAATPAPVEMKKVSNIHIVEQKETLYSLSRRYGVTVEDLMMWNQLENNNVSVGQQLIITGAAASSTSQATEVAPHIAESKPELKADTVTTPKPQSITPILAENVVEFNSRVVKVGDLEKIFEEGMAMVIENSTDTKKYLALHREADVGTVMKVKNMMNDLAIYVRVVGRLPDTGGNDRLLLKLSRTAYERLGARDFKFPVEVSYIP